MYSLFVALAAVDRRFHEMLLVGLPPSSVRQKMAMVRERCTPHTKLLNIRHFICACFYFYFIFVLVRIVDVSPSSSSPSFSRLGRQLLVVCVAQEGCPTEEINSFFAAEGGPEAQKAV